MPLKNQSCDEIFYYDQSKDLCLEYFFEGYENCIKMNPKKDECELCFQYGYYLLEGRCIKIKDCDLSDGKNDKCYRATDLSYINELGKI